MVKSYWKTSFILAMLLVGFTLAPAAFAADKPNTDNDLQKMEELGIESDSNMSPAKTNGPVTMGRGEVLLIPESSTDTVGMHDPFDGTYLGDLIQGSGTLVTPICAIMGPDGNIYVSDQSGDQVVAYDTSGNFLFTYADSTDGLDNVRGICFRKDNLFVCTYHGEVAEFDGPHSRLPDFIFEPNYVSMWDVHFLSGGDCLVNNSSSDTCAHYDSSGVFLADVLSPVDFPEQVQFDISTPGEFLINVFTDKVVHDFKLDGTIIQTTPHGMSGRGVYRLGNGNLLVTSGAGVDEIDPVTGVVISSPRSGVSARFIEPVNLVMDSLTIDNDTIVETVGGIVNFSLNADAANGNRSYLIIGGVSGSSPGTPLPGGMATLPVNWDLFTNVIIDLVNTPVFSNFLGQLGPGGKGTATFDTLGPIPGTAGITMTFAFALNAPWDFASNFVEVKIVP